MAIAILLIVTFVAGRASIPTAAQTLPEALEGCFSPDPPKRLRRQVATAIRISRDLPSSWARSPFIAKIACWQGADFATDFRERGRSYYAWHGMFAMTVEEVETIFGTWMTADRDAFRLTPRCFRLGWAGCPNTTANAAWTQQIIAALRWIRLNYGNPTAAWTHIKRTGRFNSYPRPGTRDEPTRDPFRRCPVSGRVYFQDDFGERRTVGGYHPHWGNDVSAPAGTPIRAPFDGFAVGHRDSWFAGIYVTVVGREGYARNVHLSRFGRLGT